jgi:aldose 1-epimerase
MIGEREVGGYPARTLTSGDQGGGEALEATFVPSAGMVACSLRHRGEELLGQRGGLAVYVAERGTMGIPLLHPWANRLSLMRFPLAGREVSLDPPSTTVSLDPAGLPIHGLLSAAAGWAVERHQPADDGGVLAARFDFGANDDLLAAFPFPHEIEIEATVAGPILTIETTVHATADAEVPISFGYHPYFRLPGIERAEWELELPVHERLELDERMLPTGGRQEVRIDPGPLGSRTFDDGYLAPPDSAPFALAGGGRRIEVAYISGYPYAQVYAPDDDDIVALEPMTAPTNAFVTDGPELPLLSPGESYAAAFSVTVTEA